FVQDVAGFKSFMHDHDVIVAGSAALSLLVPSTPVRDYDLYVPMRGFQLLIKYLVDVEGYTNSKPKLRRSRPRTALEYCSWNLSHFTSGISGLVRLRRGKTIVDVYCTGVGSVIDSPCLPLGYCWTTLLMNYMTFDGFRSAYPTLTLRRRGLYIYHRILHPSFPAETNPIHLNKYLRRGFQFRL
ncbi:hypothetical protein OH76DRAFT_1316346, partial [Lentinus brumalis]